MHKMKTPQPTFCTSLETTTCPSSSLVTHSPGLYSRFTHLKQKPLHHDYCGPFIKGNPLYSTSQAPLQPETRKQQNCSSFMFSDYMGSHVTLSRTEGLQFTFQSWKAQDDFKAHQFKMHDFSGPHFMEQISPMGLAFPWQFATLVIHKHLSISVLSSKEEICTVCGHKLQ